MKGNILYTRQWSFVQYLLKLKIFALHAACLITAILDKVAIQLRANILG
jgi:hypothetical protein